MKKTEFEKYLEDNTLVLGKNIIEAEKTPFDFTFEKTQKLQGGMHTHVTRIWDGQKSWAVKEGRTDIFLPLFKNLSIKGNREIAALILSPFGYDLMPKGERISKELRELFLVSKYFGYFEDDHKVVGDNEYLKAEQGKLRDELSKFTKSDSEISSLIKRLVNNKESKVKALQKAISPKDVIRYNFLVNEYVIVGKPAQAKAKSTFYIVQEWVDGETLEQLIDIELTKKTYGRLLVFLLLALYLFEKEQKIIDTRGKGLMNTNWFFNTENLVLNLETEDVKFIDTRSLWDMTGNFVEKGIFSADMILHSMVQAFGEYLSKYEKLKD